MVAGVDRCRQISKGRFRPNRPQTRANAGAPHSDGKTDGKLLRDSLRLYTNQKRRRLVDDRVGVGGLARAIGIYRARSGESAATPVCLLGYGISLKTVGWAAGSASQVDPESRAGSGPPLDSWHSNAPERQRVVCRAEFRTASNPAPPAPAHPGSDRFVERADRASPPSPLPTRSTAASRG